MALYIYRVGGLAPQEIQLQDLNLLKSLVVLGLRLNRSDPPVRPVGRTRPATDASTGQIAWAYRLDRSVHVAANFGCQHSLSQLSSLRIDTHPTPCTTLLTFAHRHTTLEQA